MERLSDSFIQGVQRSSAAGVITRELAYHRYQNLISQSRNGRSGLPVYGARRRLTEAQIRLRKWAGKYLLSPIFLAVSLPAMLFFPDNLLKKAMAPFSDWHFWERVGKRLFDIIGAILGFLASSIFFFVIPILIKLNSRGPVFYKQQRVGLNHRYRDRRMINLEVEHDRRKGERRKVNLYGRPFMLYKFRTMYVDAEKRSGAVWAKKNDPRITSIGRILRFTHVDEIPQFFNVLCGEMSLVGPRPERPQFIPKLAREIPHYPKRLQVKPGITGIAQIVCGYDETIEDVKKKLEFDLYYVKHNSLKEDISILLKTLWVIVRGKEVLED
ncbi:MAG: sugar transferase [candidate division KSB1 bacterium]|nr:sugar transferase [candidate division KSB1 bacterium]MDQ7063923.1 sugar transferase [candidate division KSB1 bacterium]